MNEAKGRRLRVGEPVLPGAATELDRLPLCSGMIDERTIADLRSYARHPYLAVPC